MDKITFCIPSKSNLRYLKTCIPSIRKNAYKKDHDIIVFVDSDEDGTIDWLKLNKDKYNINYYINPDLGKSLYGIGRAYDFCIEKSKTDVFMIFHADMMLGTNADINALSALTEKTVVCSTRIEPPLHPTAGEKILMDFGMWPEEFKEEAFNEYISPLLNSDKETDGVFAPWMMFKKDYLSTTQHDPIMHSCREDSDLFNSLTLLGYTFKQKWNSLVYHLAGRGAGSFSQDKERHAFWQKQMNNSSREFARKWGSDVRHTPLMKPIVVPKYKKLLVAKNLNKNILYEIEPYFDYLNVDIDFNEYINQEQENTSFDLSIKFIPEDNIQNCNVIVQLDGNLLNAESLHIIKNLNEIVHSNNFTGKTSVANLSLNVKNLNSYEQDNISKALHEKFHAMWSGG
jgi:glycosyltransferase involved in cell wall biosynthesis